MSRDQETPRSSVRTLVVRAGALLLLACGLLAAPAWAQHYEPMEFYHYDALGSVRLVTIFPVNSLSYSLYRHDYLPFGEEIPTGAYGRTAELGYSGGDATRHRFTGKERDTESNLDYFGARYYSGAQGRFTSVDEPLADQRAGDPQSWNLYSYGRNNPLRFTDPTGRCVVDGERHGWLWCLGHTLGLTETQKEADARIAEHRKWLAAHTTLTDPNTHRAVDPATLTNKQVEDTYKQAQLKAVGEQADRQLRLQRYAMAPIMTQWGWSGSQPYKDALKELRKPGTHTEENLGGRIPTRAEATRMIEESGGRVLRQESAHPSGGVSEHTYPHINYVTPTGASATVKVIG